jgi:hypothetical protein
MTRKVRSVLVMLAIGLLIAGCTSSKSSSSGGSTAAPQGTAALRPTGSAAPADEVGISATQIRVGMIADVNTSVVPGLFQKSVDAVKAWANIVNQSGGLAGRQVVVDFCDGKLDANATTNCVIHACENDFAMVGTMANVLTDISDISNCKNKQGQAVGIPNLAAIAFAPLTCEPHTYVIVGQGSYCATINDHPQTFTVNVGDFRYYASQHGDLHGIWLYNGDVPAVKIVSVPAFTAGSNLGIKKDGEGFYTSTGQAPQSAMTAFNQVLKRSGSNFAYDGATAANLVLLRREAQLQGVNSVKVWGCNSGCYDASFLKQGGSAVEGTSSPLYNLPFYTEYQSNPALAALIQQLGGVDKLSNNALGAYLQALLFQDVVEKAVAGGGPLNRQALFTALKNEHAFNAKGIIGPTDVANHTPSPCVVITQVTDGKWQRVFPTKPGTFDCNPANVVQIKMDLST